MAQVLDLVELCGTNATIDKPLGFHVKAKPKQPAKINGLKALRKAVKRKDKVTVVRTIKPAPRGR